MKSVLMRSAFLHLPLVLIAFCPNVLVAQDPFGGSPRVIMQNGQPVQISPGQATPVPPGAQPGAKPSASKKGGKPGEEAKGKDGKGKEGEKDGEKKTITRPTEPPEPPNPKELDVALSEAGTVEFQFRNQPWKEVLKWLATVSDLSLDWQELPGDYLNLKTNRPFSLEETTDVINRALLMRGFTMLEHEGVLTIAKTQGINPSLVPRVEPGELANLPPHSFVRTSYTLTWLLAEDVHQEFASMISSNGKLTPLTSTNRIEAMDAAANLRDIHDIIQNEQSATALQNLAREFPLEHARASSVKTQLEAFLGIRSSSPSGSGGYSSSTARMMQQQMQQMQQMMQQAARNRGAQAGGAAKQRSTEVYLVANDRSNSIIVHAPPNKMAIIESFIKRVDVQNANAADFQRMTTRMKVFRLASLSPTDLVSSLEAMDVLEPTARLQVDDENNAIIAYASVADQYLIQSVIDRLDGSERSFEVIQLRRLEAESVAGSIQFLMGAEEEEDSSRNNPYGYYDPWSYRSSSQKKKKGDKMRVGANTQDNQLLLWANSIEMEEVQNLLVKLGEIPPEGGDDSTMRVITASRQPETYEYLMQLKEQWDKVSPNPLVLPDQNEFKKRTFANAEEEGEEPSDSAAEPAEAEAEVDEAPAAPPVTADDGNITSNVPLEQRVSEPATSTRLVSTPTDPPAANQESSDTTQASPPGKTASVANQAEDAKAPIEIMLDERGNLVIQSKDTRALDRLEEIMSANRPPQRPYVVFKVKYASAGWVALNLREYFDKREGEEDNGRSRFFGFFGREEEKKTRQLGDKPKIEFIYDNDTQSIVVQNADDVDRQTIQELIDLWDVPEPQASEDKARYTELVRVRYSRADAIVNTLKEAYRDLLSANDKTFEKQGDEDEEKRSGSGGSGVGSGGGLSFAFKGKLSLGVDSITNSILVSAEGKALLQIMVDMITQLDEAAKPEGNVEVLKLSSGINGRSLEQALRAMMGKQGQVKSSNQQQQPNQGQPQQPNAQPNANPFPGQAAPSASRRRGRGSR